MSPTSTIPAIVSVLLSLTICFSARNWIRLPNSENRCTGIDGLRGYLAFFVFLHHSCIWYFYLHEAKWTSPPSIFYYDLGFCSVSMFFMITGFLFFTKILESDNKPIDWVRLYCSRITRLVPLYLLAVLFISLVVGARSNWIAIEPPEKIAGEVLRWLVFTIPGGPNINGLNDTGLIPAGVTWTLPHEWKFYASLPFIALLARKRTPLPLIISGVAFFALWHPNGTVLTSFLSGILASVLSKKSWFTKIAASRVSSFLVLISGILTLNIPMADSDWCILPLGISFALIASGCSFFGIFEWKSSRLLGEISYSIYLLHGILLYVAYHFVFGIGYETSLSPQQYWLNVILLVPVLICACMATFAFVEQPGMNAANKLAAFTKSLLRSS